MGTLWVGEAGWPRLCHLSANASGGPMRAQGEILAGLCVVALLSVSTVASAADVDLRLVQAAAAQDRVAVRTLLREKRIDVNAARADGATALLWAAHWNDLEMADLLLRAGAKVNQADD